MVQLSSRLFLVAAAIASCYASPFTKRNPIDDAGIISGSVALYSEAVDTFPADINKYRSAGEAINRAFIQGADNLVEQHLAGEEATAVFDSFVRYAPTLRDSVREFTVKKNAIPNAPPILNKSIEILGESTKKYEDAIVSALPEEYVEKVQALAQQVNEAFADAVTGAVPTTLASRVV